MITSLLAALAATSSSYRISSTPRDNVNMKIDITTIFGVTLTAVMTIALGVAQSGKSPAEHIDSVSKTAAIGSLDLIQVRPSVSMDGYSRKLFKHWTDPDGNGCTADADAKNQHMKIMRNLGRCNPTDGVLDDTYSGRRIEWQKGTTDEASMVDIDHIVSLGDAWRTGAQQWDPILRERFANDPMNLLPVSASENRAKGDRPVGDRVENGRNIEGWLPSNKGYHCEYVRRQLDIKIKWKLWVTPGEKEAMQKVLIAC